MATYQVRHLHCIPCDTPVRVRNRMAGPIEVLEPCPHCDGELVDVGTLNLTTLPGSDEHRQQYRVSLFVEGVDLGVWHPKQ